MYKVAPDSGLLCQSLNLISNISQQITLRRVGLGLLQTLHLIAGAFWDNLIQLSFFYLYYFRELQIYEKPVCGDFGIAKGFCSNDVLVYEGNYIELK